jgi:quercetin dioxygenase-like cupin family protein
MSNLVDIADQPVITLWGEHVRARRVQGQRITFAVIELDPNADLPQHAHEAEQMGMVIVGGLRFELGGEVRELGPGGTWRVPSTRPHKATAGPDGATCIDVFTPVRADWDGLPTAPASAPRWPRAIRQDPS